MSDARGEIERLGGAAKTVELRAAGVSKRALAAAVRRGLLLRPRKAWYVLPETPADLVAAVRVGGRATCVTALPHAGVWITDPVALTHVAVHRAASRLRAASNPRERQTRVGDAVVHWRDTPSPRRSTGSRLLEPAVRALQDAVGCLSGEELFATAESALRLRLVTAREWATILASTTQARRSELSAAGSLSESGLESLFVSRIRRLGIRVRQQAQLGRDRVDCLIGERLVIELDGARFHDPHVDRVRDARLTAAGFRVLRFDYWQVMSDWPAVERAVVASIVRSDHLA